MARRNQTAHTADSFPLNRRAFSRILFIARASLLFLVSFLLLASMPDNVFCFSQGDLYRQAKAATVLIVGVNDESHALSFGSGVVISEQGLVLTNAHVVEDSTRLFVYIRNQAIDSGATVLAIDSDLDLATLHIHTDLPV